MFYILYSHDVINVYLKKKLIHKSTTLQHIKNNYNDFI